MPRHCNLCSAEEYVLQVDAKIRAGESLASIAKQFGFSEDAVSRHAHNHVRKEKPSTIADPLNMSARLELLWARADETYVSAAKTGSYKTMTDALGRLVAIAESLSRVNVGKSGFETLSIEGKVTTIMADAPLYMALLDAITKSLYPSTLTTHSSVTN
jgi:hypothetical protein